MLVRGRRFGAEETVRFQRNATLCIADGHPLGFVRPGALNERDAPCAFLLRSDERDVVGAAYERLACLELDAFFAFFDVASHASGRQTIPDGFAKR